MSSKKIVAENYKPPENPPAVVVREYEEARDKVAVEDLERQCEVGQPGHPTLVTDLMGDPVARVRNFDSHVMMVAEYGNGREIVGVIRGCIKTVSIGKRCPRTQLPIYKKLAYILGLRVSSSHRRLGIATKLVQEFESWSQKNGAEYAYMATECNNKPSLNLFTEKCNYVKFRNPTVLVQPVHLHHNPIPSDIAIIHLSSELAATIYRRIFFSSEFFPEDIDILLNKNHSLGTFIALPRKTVSKWRPETGILPDSFAILSVWNTKEVFRLQVKGVSVLTKVACLGTRVFDAMFPWLKIPSIPNFCKNFGFYFLYGLHMEGKNGPLLMKTLCKFAYNMGREDRDCRVLVAEVGQMDPVRKAIPHWKKFSWDEDVWCIKKLEEKNSDHWYKSQEPSPVMFVDPREL
ncbi:Aminoglycoside N(3')-acetyltransferase [Handroanthus impetiginosus]|uniref:Aminoglycoside N(3')-acetyltransferase n=1 Tax=Handroanthus impetiginosus TaxID=429701 RepID=A0A2G9G6D7_9LAMI|nr:Aminoglycoside N(3')-acetyltransferase [Handroanthus impetiginosus]